MKTTIIMLCAIAALAGCSRQGGTGSDRYRTTGGSKSTEESTTITNTDTNQPNTNRFGTPGSSGTGSEQTQPKSSGERATPPPSGTQ